MNVFFPKWATLTRSGVNTARMNRRWASMPLPWRILRTTTGQNSAKEKAALSGVAGTCLNTFKRPAASFSCGAELKHGGFRFYFHSVCQEYFLDGGMKRMLEKDEKSAKLSMAPTASPVPAQPFSTIPRWVPAWNQHRNLCLFLTYHKNRSVDSLLLMTWVLLYFCYRV